MSPAQAVRGARQQAVADGIQCAVDGACAGDRERLEVLALDRADWDLRDQTSEPIWPLSANRFVVEEPTGPAGFRSAGGLAKAARLTQARGVAVDW